MPTYKVITSYAHESDMDIEAIAKSAVANLRDNSNFVWQNGEVKTLEENFANYSASLISANKGGQVEVANKNAQRKLVLGALSVIGNGVNLQANGDLLKLQTSGLTLAKLPVPVGPLPKPTGFKVVSGANSGEFLCTVDANKDASIYQFYWAAVPAPANIADWHQVSSTVRKKLMTGFTPGTQYALRCAYQGSDPSIIYSDIITIFAQ